MNGTDITLSIRGQKGIANEPFGKGIMVGLELRL